MNNERYAEIERMVADCMTKHNLSADMIHTWIVDDDGTVDLYTKVGHYIVGKVAPIPEDNEVVD